MTEKKNIAASVRQRLLNHATESGENFNLLLMRFANERLLYRLGVSKFKDRFVLKGASLFTLWFNTPHRPTRDIDLLGFGYQEIAEVEKIFKEICEIRYEDGLLFKPETIMGSEIKGGQNYKGVRISFMAMLGTARINLQIDVGYGDAITLGTEPVDFPTILDFPEPHLKAYPKETVVAEKFEAMVKLGLTNSRMKDLDLDLDLMIGRFEFDGAEIQNAIKATFERRGTAIPEQLPLALTAEFSEDSQKQMQWKAFLSKNKLPSGKDLKELNESLGIFFLPIIESIRTEGLINARWKNKNWDIDGKTQ